VPVPAKNMLVAVLVLLAIGAAPEKDRYEITLMRSEMADGWVRADRDGYVEGGVALKVIAVQFRVNGKGTFYPHTTCYYYDSNKKLLGQSQSRLKKVHGQVERGRLGAVQGGQLNTILFDYAPTDRIGKWRYAIVVIGDDDEKSAEIYPRGTKLDDFDFPEKSTAKMRK
jgi:hypothetical protein